MKLKVVSKPSEEKKVDRVKLGKRSKRKGSNYERDVAKKFKEAYNVDLVRTPQSGGFHKKSGKADDYRGDIVPANSDVELALHIECKNTKTWSLPSWLKQSESDCPKDKIPVVVFHKHNTTKDYITLSLSDFIRLVDKNKIIKENT